MRKLLLTLLILVLVSGLNKSFAQDWTSEQISILDQFGLEKNDIRGIVFTQSGTNPCNQEVSTVKEALELFLNAQVKRDITTFCISELNSDLITFEQPLDIFQIVSLYIETKK